MKRLSPILFLVLFFACAEAPLSENKFETLVIPCGEKVSIQTEGGINFEFKENSFDCGTTTTVFLEYRAAMDKPSMVLDGLHTISNDGRVLESGGMLQFEANVPIDEGFYVDVPYVSSPTKMQLFKLSDDGTWGLEGDLNVAPSIEITEGGERLYDVHCKNCHSKDMSAKLTGPALGNIHLKRSKEWLYDFTRNSQKMINEGNPEALCVWYEWQPVLMNNFTLSDAELDSIYAYVERESVLQGIDWYKEGYEKTECENLVESDSFYVPNFFFTGGHSSSQGGKRFILPIDTFGWYNVDAFVNAPPIVESPLLKFKGKRAARNIVMIYKDRNIIIPFYPEGGREFRLLNSYGKSILSIPTGEVVVLSYPERLNGEYGWLETEINKTGNEFEFSLDFYGFKEFEERVKTAF